jgi:hypothetical protein
MDPKRKDAMEVAYILRDDRKEKSGDTIDLRPTGAMNAACIRRDDR